MTPPAQADNPGEHRDAPRRRGPNAATPARRAQIVRAALASFAQHGYERASLRDIAARAQVTHAALLRHFSGKDELLVAALTQRDQDEENLATQILAAGSAGSATVLGQVLRDEFANPDYQRNWMALVLAATDPGHPAHEYFTARRNRLRAHLASDPLPTAEDSAHLSADEKVTLLLAMIDGLRLQALLDPTREPLRLLEVFMKLVILPVDGPPTP